MRGLIAAIGVMSVLIVVGVAVIGVTIVRRIGAMPTAPVTQALDEPVGTRIAGIATLPEGLAVLLQGGGPDRVMVVDPKLGRTSILVKLKP